MIKTCVWVVTTNVGTRPCNEPTSYVMVPDGGEPGAPLVRKYNLFCDVHQKRHDAKN
jgi:hypothetical protein